MNKLAGKIVALGLCAAIGAGGVYAAAAQTAGRQEEASVVQTAAVQGAGPQEASKNETVYVLAGADGSVEKIIVSDWIKNALGKETISDRSDLASPENVKGEQSYTISGDGMKVWDAQGNDIYYRGDIEKELPVGLTVSYKLDGKSVSADEIAGKSGRVTIRFDYENRQYEMVRIDGRQEKIYVPFAMLTGMLLDNDTFRNVEVSNGKLLNDGDRTIVAGLAFPGLQENLGLSRDKIEIPDYVEITADAENFAFGMTVTVATNELFSDLDAGRLDSVGGGTGALGELSDAMTRLTDGSSALYDGLCTLLEKSDALVSGVSQLAEGAKALQEGAGSLDEGAARLKAGLSELSAGLNTLSANSAELNSGAAQVFSTLLSTATEQLRGAGVEVPDLTIGNYADVLGGIIASLDQTAVYQQAMQQVAAAVEEKRPEITEKVIAAVKEQVAAQVTAAVQAQVTDGVTKAIREQAEAQVIGRAAGMSKADYDAAVSAGRVSGEQQAAIEAAVAEQMASEAVGTAIKAQTKARMESGEIKAVLSANIDEQMQSEPVRETIAQNVELQVQKAVSENMASEAVQAKLAEASAGAPTIISLKASLDSYNSFYRGLCAYTGGVDTAAGGADSLSGGAAALKDGAAQLKAGAAALYDGALTLKDGMPALVDGVTQLRDGSMELSDGLKQFSEQGVQKLIDLLEGDLAGAAARLRATIDVSKDYRNFAGIESGMDGRVKFIYRTGEIKLS